MSDLDNNPKTRFGVRKPGLADIPPVALFVLGQGMTDGRVKYGRTNWRENDVTASVYYNAALRHLMSWWDGEQTAKDSGIHHLGHAMACMAILIDAEEGKNLVDDRPSVPGQTSAFLARMTAPLEPEEPEPWDLPEARRDRVTLSDVVDQIAARGLGID